VKFAMIVVSAFSDHVQAPVPLQVLPLQPVNCEPGAGTAVQFPVVPDG
jgi:hypothetical protein